MPESLNFNARDTTVKDVLFAKNFFKIPRYQREFSWGEDQLIEFWNDLTSISDTYFLGSWIFNLESLEETGRIDIIDGQQRIITITIFMAALRDLAKDLNEEASNLIQRSCIADEDWMGKYTMRVIPGESSQDYLHTYIQSGDSDILTSKPNTAEERKIKKAYQLLHEKAQDYINTASEKEKKIKRLYSLRDAVAKLIVIEIQIQNEEEAYEIFETTNARGIELSVADLLKNLIFKKIPEKDIKDLAKDVWAEITDNIKQTDTEIKKFIRYFWISKYSFVSYKRLYREIKSEITDWEQFLDDLYYSSIWYSRLLIGNLDDLESLKHSTRIYNALFSLRIMGVTQCYVFLLTLLVNYEHLNTDPVRIFEIIEKFSFIYSSVCRLPGNKVERLYSRYAINIQQALLGPDNKISANVQSVFSAMEAELNSMIPTRDFFIQKFQDISYINSPKGRMLITYIFSRFESYYRNTDEMTINFDKVNIEHLLPQKPSDEWGLTMPEIKPYVNKLGNLTLLSKRLNSQIQNGVVQEKLPHLEKSELFVTKELTKEIKEQECKWDQEKILARQNKLAEISFDHIWR